MPERSANSIRSPFGCGLWLRAFGENDEIEHIFDWRDHLFGGDCVYLTNRATLDAWRRGDEPETAAGQYIRNQELVETIYAGASWNADQHS